MSTRPAHELLYDSEAVLRLVDNVLDEFRGSAIEHGDPEDDERVVPDWEWSGPAGAAAPPKVPLRAYSGILSALARIRENRSALERAAETRAAGSGRMPDAADSRTPQEITAQQLTDATNVLLETERRLAQIATLFEQRVERGS